MFVFALPITTEAMRIWRFAGAFTVAKRQGECGSKDTKLSIISQVRIDVC